MVDGFIIFDGLQATSLIELGSASEPVKPLQVFAPVRMWSYFWKEDAAFHLKRGF